MADKKSTRLLLAHSNTVVQNGKKQGDAFFHLFPVGKYQDSLIHSAMVMLWSAGKV
jgi:hypothetical protein